MLDDDSSSSSNPTTPPNTTAATAAAHVSSELSPPDSQNLAPQHPQLAPSPFTPLSARGASAANAGRKMAPSDKVNANGKREWDPSHKNDPANAAGLVDKSKKNSSTDATMSGEASTTNGSAHGPYKWEREEDAPGYAWTNSKARDDFARVWAGVVDKERGIGNKYGDVLLTK